MEALKYCTAFTLNKRKNFTENVFVQYQVKKPEGIIGCVL